MTNDKRTLLALFALAIALLLWRALGPSAVSNNAPTTVAPNASHVEEADAVAESATPNRKVLIQSALPAAAATTPSLVPPLRMRRLDDYADAVDLQSFVDGLRAAADAGDGEAAALIARAYDECSLWVLAATTGRRKTVDPATLAEPQRSIAAAQTAITERRCAGIVAEAMRHGVGWSHEQIKLYWAKARDGGELMQLLSESDLGPLELSSADDVDLLRRIAASGNDDAIFGLAHRIGADASGEHNIQGPFSGSPADAAAWMLVSCNLGRDCEPNGRLVRQQCLMLNQCNVASYRDYMRYFHFTPYQYDEALKKERQIMELLARGAVDELFSLRPKRD